MSRIESRVSMPKQPPCRSCDGFYRSCFLVAPRAKNIQNQMAKIAREQNYPGPAEKNRIDPTPIFLKALLTQGPLPSPGWDPPVFTKAKAFLSRGLSGNLCPKTA